MATCPFQSGPLFDSGGVLVEMHYESCPESSSCQIWDSINGRCGAKVSDTIRGNSNENDTLITMLETILGKQSEKDESNSLIKYLQDVIGKSSERDEDDSLIKYLQDVVGKQSEKDESNSLIKYLQDVIGKYQNANGETLLTLESHKHDSHYHMNPHDCQEMSAGCGSVSSVSNKATILIGEFHGNEDLDNNGLIYGKDFKIEDDGEKPPTLLTIENSPSWVEPSSTVKWSEYIGE